MTFTSLGSCYIDLLVHAPVIEEGREAEILISSANIRVDHAGTYTIPLSIVGKGVDGVRINASITGPVGDATPVAHPSDIAMSAGVEPLSKGLLANTPSWFMFIRIL